MRCELKINSDHFQILEKCGRTSQGQVGYSPRQWYGYAKPLINSQVVVKNIDDAKLPEKKQSRDDIDTFISEGNLNLFELSVVILAWGGMNRDYGGRAFQSAERWVPLLSKFRNGEQDAFSVYEKFQKMRRDEKSPLKGMGPAYFTKLIYFFPDITRLIADI